MGNPTKKICLRLLLRKLPAVETTLMEAIITQGQTAGYGDDLMQRK